MDTPTKRCSKCGEVKPITEFHIDRKQKDGRKPACRVCTNLKKQEWRHRNAEKVNAGIQKWRESHREQHRAGSRAYYYAHREEYLERSRQWAQYMGRDGMRLYEQKHRKNYPEYDTARIHRRRARKVSAPGPHFTAQEWRDLKTRHNYTCLCCHRTEPEIKLTPDHVIPLATGGSDAIENIQPLCYSCNSRKGAKTIDYR